MTAGLFNNRKFRCDSNSAGGQTDARTLFHYRQEGSIVWATYAGGEVQFGVLIATVDDSDELTMRYQQIDVLGRFRSGQCHSRPELHSTGRVILHETWQWDDGGTGTSTLVEI